VIIKMGDGGGGSARLPIPIPIPIPKKGEKEGRGKRTSSTYLKSSLMAWKEREKGESDLQHPLYEGEGGKEKEEGPLFIRESAPVRRRKR